MIIAQVNLCMAELWQFYCFDIKFDLSSFSLYSAQIASGI